MQLRKRYTGQADNRTTLVTSFLWATSGMKTQGKLVIIKDSMLNVQ